MFDLRYHVASLAAVFFALVIGILVGVALASHGLGNTERDSLERNLRVAQDRADGLQAQLDAIEEAGASDRAFVEESYELVIANRLKGRRIAVLFVGSIERAPRSEIEQAVSDAGAGQPLRFRALTVPIDEREVANGLPKRPFFAAYSGEKQLGKLGQAMGEEFITGSDTSLWDALEGVIVEERSGPLKLPVDGVVIVRTVPAQTGSTAKFLKGLYAGIRGVGVPAVGVELTDGDGSATAAFKKAKLATVDNVDTRIGKLALAIVLSEEVKGNFGTKQPTADDGLLPTVGPPPTDTTGG